MQALEVMAREHQTIDTLLQRLEGQVQELERSGELDLEVFERVLSFFERCVDGHHQEKEEREFLPRLAARASGEDATLAQAATVDHHEQRLMLALVRSNLEGAMYGEPNALAVVARFARSYIRHQREHSRWETSVLFALAHRVLTPEDDRAILCGFRALEEALGGSILTAGAQLEAWLEQRCTSLSAPASTTLGSAA